MYKIIKVIQIILYIQIDDVEMRQKWLEQEQQAVELLKQQVALEEELFELKQRQRDENI